MVIEVREKYLPSPPHLIIAGGGYPGFSMFNLKTH